MGALLFTVKSIILTVFLIAILQIHWDGESFEERISRYSRETGVLNIADDMARGIIRFAENNFNLNINEEKYTDPKDDLVRAAKHGFNRSEIYMTEKSETARRAIEKFRNELKEKKKQKQQLDEVTSEEIY